MVLFTNEPLFIGGEEFRVMRISATYGHGEGVVGNQGIAADTMLILNSMAHPDQIYILYDNQEKPERLAPVMIGGKVMLKKVANNQEMIKKPVLGKEAILRLYQWGILGEKFFEDYPTDMEIVMKGGTIYPVQARPINRPALLPTYLDLKKIQELSASPITQTITAEMLVPGKTSVVEIDKQEDVLISETLEKAEGLFRKGQHKLVVVGQQEPANSHPVVNFSSLGMPCLFAKDLSAVQNMVKEVNDKHPLAVCVQSATLSLWDGSKGAISDFTSSGFVIHPAKISISLPVEKPVPQMAGVNFELPLEVNDLLRKFGSITNKKIGIELLQSLQRHPWITGFKEKIDNLEKQTSAQSLLKKMIGPIIETAKALDEQIDEAFAQVKALLEHPRKEAKLELLFHVKTLKNLLQNPSVEGVSKHSVSSYEATFQAAEALISYQSKLNRPAIFADVLMDGTQSPVDEVFEDWNAFLLKLEPIAQKTLEGKRTGMTPSDISEFKNTLAKLREGDVLPLFMTFFLGEVENPVETVLKINQMMQASDKPMIDEIAIQKKKIGQLKNEIAQFGDPKAFPIVWERLKILAGTFSPEKLPWLQKDKWELSSPVARSLVIKSMNDLIDIYDLAIKSMKASQQLDSVEKTQKFKEMLGPYFELFKVLAEGMVGTKGFVTHVSWPLPLYLKTIKSKLDEMSDSDPIQLESSRDFCVSAATLGSATFFARHYPQRMEDVFTLIHQNLMASTSKLTQGLFSSDQLLKSRLPENFKKSFTDIGKISKGRDIGTPQPLGIEVDKSGIVVHYNIPLRAHSAKFSIHYNTQTKQLSMKSLFLGPSGRNDIHGPRWNYGMARVSVLNTLDLVPLKSKIKITTQELSYTWDITKEGSLEELIKNLVNSPK